MFSSASHSSLHLSPSITAFLHTHIRIYGILAVCIFDTIQMTILFIYLNSNSALVVCTALPYIFVSILLQFKVHEPYCSLHFSCAILCVNCIKIPLLLLMSSRFHRRRRRCCCLRFTNHLSFSYVQRIVRSFVFKKRIRSILLHMGDYDKFVCNVSQITAFTKICHIVNTLCLLGFILARRKYIEER